MLTASVIALAVLALTARTASAQATEPAPQTRSTVQPTIGASIVFDDNVFAQQTSNADTVLRISPGLSLIRVRPKAIFTGTYFLDAEKYQRFTELTTPQARQNGMFLAEFNPTRRRFWSVTGGYFSTTNPAELNTITALTVTRQRADRLQGGAKFRQELSRRVTFETGYTATHDDFVNGGTIAHLAERGSVIT